MNGKTHDCGTCGDVGPCFTSSGWHSCMMCGTTWFDGRTANEVRNFGGDSDIE